MVGLIGFHIVPWIGPSFFLIYCSNVYELSFLDDWVIDGALLSRSSLDFLIHVNEGGHAERKEATFIIPIIFREERVINELRGKTTHKKRERLVCDFTK